MRRKNLLSILRSAFRTDDVPGRRLFLKATAAAWLTGALGIGCKDPQPGYRDAGAANPDDPAEQQNLLALVAGAVLPSEIGTSEHRRIAEEFSAWLDGYDPTTEPAQRSTYDYTPNARLAPYPRSRVNQDLREIESLSRQQFSRPFGDLDLAGQQTLLRGLLAQRPAGTVHGWIFRQDGHVVLSLLDFYYHFRMVHRSRRRK